MVACARVIVRYGKIDGFGHLSLTTCWSALRPSMWTFGVRVAAAEKMGLSAYLLPHRRGVKFFARIFLPRGCDDECGACIFSRSHVGSAHARRIVYNGVS